MILLLFSFVLSSFFSCDFCSFMVFGSDRFDYPSSLITQNVYNNKNGNAFELKSYTVLMIAVILNWRDARRKEMPFGCHVYEHTQREIIERTRGMKWEERRSEKNKCGTIHLYKISINIVFSALFFAFYLTNFDWRMKFIRFPLRLLLFPAAKLEIHSKRFNAININILFSSLILFRLLLLFFFRFDYFLLRQTVKS